jgi:hypothetical protein
MFCGVELIGMGAAINCMDYELNGQDGPMNMGAAIGCI